MNTRVLTLFALAAGLAGCSKPYVRPYEWRDEQAALEALAARADSIKTIRAACGLTLTDPKGESVNFDGALVVRLEPDRVWLRLRTWKLGQAVFDATVRPDGVWLFTSDEAAKRTSGDRLKSARPEQIAAAMRLMSGDFFKGPDLQVHNRQEFAVTRPLEDGSIVAFIDRETLTVYEYSIRDASNRERQQLTLDTYREIPPGATPFPKTIRASGPDGAIEVRLEDVELNTPIEDAAFTPPRRAVKQ